MFNGRRLRATCYCALLGALLARARALQSNDRCTAGDNATFRVRVDLFASQTGEFTFDGCQGPSPVLQLAPGVTYTFLQEDATNIGHPLMFAYAPDGDLAGAPELEAPTPRDCALPRFACSPGVAQAPVFLSDGVASPSSLSEDSSQEWALARQAYVLAFQAPEAAWAAQQHAVQLTIPADSKTATLFYHCGLFPGMSGRIDVMHPPGTPGLNALPAPFDPAAYYERLRSPARGLDLACGTRGLGDAAPMGMMGAADARGMMPRAAGGGAAQWGGMLGGGGCGSDSRAAQFAVCMAAIERAMMMPSMMMDMMHGGCDAPLAMFVKQMIPHHEGAVNMAKAALKLGADTDGFADLSPLLRNVVNTQNLQVYEMRDWQRRFDAASAQGGQAVPRDVSAPAPSGP